MVMLLLGRVPREGDSVDWADWKFEVVDMDGRRIDKVLAIPLSGAKKTEEPEGSSAS
jgi:putative hemolysin